MQVANPFRFCQEISARLTAIARGLIGERKHKYWRLEVDIHVLESFYGYTQLLFFSFVYCYHRYTPVQVIFFSNGKASNTQNLCA